MKTRAVVAGGLLALAGVWAISAVGQSMLIEPAEYPPVPFEGREYVDSKGCVFIRAGVDGATNWVPRVTRDRNPVCGFEPTFTTQQLAALNAPVAEPTVIEPMVMVEPTPAPMPAASSARTVTASSDPNVVNDIFVGGSTNYASSGTTGYVSTGGSSSTSVPRNVPGQVVNDIYVGNGGFAATTASTSVSPSYSTGTNATNYVRTTGTSPALSIGIPNSRNGVPGGYKQAWDDGRINMQRGPQSSSGDASMNQVWTQTIPRQLVAGSSRAQRVSGGFGNSIRNVIPWMSSKDVAPGSAGAFIQIGAFGSADNVSKNLSLLSQMGMGAVVQDAGSVQVILAGPFSGSDARSALNHLRSSGYSDAFIR
ncbi:MAG: SPOR domain-containing protein [Paracoccaceae bacterium]|nr:SPOR domain-containing protein [Paracoccaceae bacterium]MDG1738346.1 SPOR domain-containing protein [Paracoccaceae bacterium]MDG2258901.1 SPOR domain-containing protein [Paracoccaceae bacterium]